MYAVVLTALGVGGATVFGAVMGFLFRGLALRHSGAILGFGAGVMLAASVLGLILPAVEHGGKYGITVSVIGIFAGAACLYLIERFLPHVHGAMDCTHTASCRDVSRERVLLFVLAIALHNLPEGIAAGVGFGTGNMADALLIAGGIALQNVPEGMVIIGPMLGAGFSRRKTFFYALFTGIIEVVGTFIGYFAVGLATAVLPFALAFAGGCMLYVISDEIIPEMNERGRATPVFSLLAGFCLMLIFDALL